MTEKEYELKMRILRDQVKGRGSNLTVDDGRVLFDILSRVEKTDLENDLLHAEVVLLKEDLRMMGAEKRGRQRKIVRLLSVLFTPLSAEARNVKKC